MGESSHYSSQALSVFLCFLLHTQQWRLPHSSCAAFLAEVARLQLQSIEVKHLDSTPSFPTWKELTSIPWTLKSYCNAPMIKTTRSGPAGFLIILSSAERIILMLQTNWLLVPSMLATRFLGQKSVIISQTVMIKVVLSRMLKNDTFLPSEIFMSAAKVNQTRNLGRETQAECTWQCPPCDEDWDKDLWEQTSTPFVWGTPNYCGNNSPASNVVMEHKSNLASGMRIPKSLPYVLPWKNDGNAQ
ncbi:Gametocyte-specific factor 1 [Manis javanica]|nr:Gametocyte-specific factor 1 [Manis javanica]